MKKSRKNCKENEQEEPYQQEGSSVYYRKQ